MKPDRSDLDIAAMMDDPRWVEDALATAAAKAIRLHRMLGVPLAIWRDGRVVLVMADELLPSELPRDPSDRPPRA